VRLLSIILTVMFCAAVIVILAVAILYSIAEYRERIENDRCSREKSASFVSKIKRLFQKDYRE